MELPELGAHCQVCNRNDYLPFKCTYCSKMVCLEHKSNHFDCPINKQTFDSSSNLNSNNTLPESLKEVCQVCKSPFLKVELVLCNHCSKNYCLSHRHQHQHDCPSIETERDLSKLSAQHLAEKSREALEKLKPHLKVGPPKSLLAPAAKPQDNSKLAKKVRLMKLKLNSRGVHGTPEKDRIYFICKYCHNPESCQSHESNEGKCINFYASPEQSIGRLVDWTANELNVSYSNNFNQKC